LIERFKRGNIECEVTKWKSMKRTHESLLESKSITERCLR